MKLDPGSDYDFRVVDVDSHGAVSLTFYAPITLIGASINFSILFGYSQYKIVKLLWRRNEVSFESSMLMQESRKISVLLCLSL